MILSVSRRTDVPRYYFDWFLNRLDAGYVLVRNPMNVHQVSRITLSPEVVDGIVFWTKNPAPMWPLPDRLKEYPYYIQFTVNAYGRELECHLPDKGRLIELFRRFGDGIGPERMVWRFSPVFFNARYTAGFQADFFAATAAALRGYTKQCKLSFLDSYPKIRKAMRTHGVSVGTAAEQLELTRSFRTAAEENGITLSACGNAQLAAAGIPPARCVDTELFAKLTGCSLRLGKDPGQRPDCSCVSSIDIGAYDSCLNGCAYCYANASEASIRRSRAAYDPASPLLCGMPGPDDRITVRKVKSDRTTGTDVPDLFSR